jgi:hypothetical protein
MKTTISFYNSTTALWVNFDDKFMALKDQHSKGKMGEVYDFGVGLIEVKATDGEIEATRKVLETQGFTFIYIE